MGRPRKVWPAADVALLIRMRESGRTWREIGEALGRPHMACLRYWSEVLGR